MVGNMYVAQIGLFLPKWLSSKVEKKKRLKYQSELVALQP